MPSASDYHASLRRLAQANEEIAAVLTEMKAVYPPETIQKHLLLKAAALQVDACWKLSDIHLWFAENSPEAMLLQRRAFLTRLPTDAHTKVSDLLIGRALCCLNLSPTAVFETRDGQLRVSNSSDSVGSWIAELGECADPRCACCRAVDPMPRRRFSERLLSIMASKRHAGAIRYVTLGSGGMLFDLELILAMQARFGTGCVKSVLAVDKRYCFDGSSVLRFSSIMPDDCDVFAFSHLDSLVAMAQSQPDVFGEADILVQVDADDIEPEVTDKIVSAVVKPGGVALVLRGNGTMYRLPSTPFAASPPRGNSPTMTTPLNEAVEDDDEP